MAAPTDSTEWATSAGAEISEPSTGQKQTGWTHGTKPPAHWFNWWMRAVYRWIAYYGTKDAANGLVGLDANAAAAIAAASGASGAALTVTTSKSNGTAISGTGNGTGVGLTGVGGGSSGTGVSGTGGAGNGRGVAGVGTGSQSGVEGTGGPTDGTGVKGIGGATNGIGVYGDGSGTGVGGYFDGAGSGAAASDDAVELAQNLKLSGTNPTSTTGFSNRLTKSSLPKAWGTITTDGAGGATVNSGFNIASVSISGGNLRVNLTTGFANAASYGFTATCNGGTQVLCSGAKNSGTQFDVTATSTAGGGTNLGSASSIITVQVFGVQ